MDESNNMNDEIRRIYKYKLESQDVQDIKLPLGAKILSVGMQGEEATMWALVDPEAPTEFTKIYIVGTGQPADHVEGLTFVGHLRMGSFEFFVFADPTIQLSRIT